MPLAASTAIISATSTLSPTNTVPGNSGATQNNGRAQLTTAGLGTNTIIGSIGTDTILGGSGGSGSGLGGSGGGFGGSGGGGISTSGSGLGFAATTSKANNSFPVAVITSTSPRQNSLLVNTPIANQVVLPGTHINITIPTSAFSHTNPDANVQLTATRANGSALPAWIAFNPRTGTFEGTPPPGFNGEVTVKVIARDNDGREAVSTFKISIGSSEFSGTSR